MSLESPFSVLFNSEGVELAVTASQSGSFETGTQPGFLIMGSGSTGAQFLRLADDGALFITGAVTDTIDITGALVITGTVNQGEAGTIAESWFIQITDGTQVLGTGSSAPLFVSGTVAIEGGELNVVVSGANFDPDGNLLVALSGVGVYNEHLQVTGTVNIVQPVTVTGSVSTTTIKCPNTTVTSWGASTVSATVLTASSLRCAGTFFMDGNATAFIKLGTGANSTGSFTVKVGNNGFFELPDNYTGAVSVVFDKDDSSKILRITEIFE